MRVIYYAYFLADLIVIMMASSLIVPLSWHILKLRPVSMTDVKRLWPAALYLCAFFVAADAFGKANDNYKFMDSLLATSTAWWYVGIGILGPLATGYVIQELRRGLQRTGLCAQCLYDLTGNTSGVCPECGNPWEHAADSRSARLRPLVPYPWRRILPFWLAGVAMLALLSMYHQVAEAYVCSECCRSYVQFKHRLALPVGQRSALVEFDALKLGPATTLDGLPQQLDPSSTCRHHWIEQCRSAEGLLGSWSNDWASLCHNDVDLLPDFPRFLKARPDVLKRIRKSVRARVPIEDWLNAEYAEWASVDEKATAQHASPNRPTPPRCASSARRAGGG